MHKTLLSFFTITTFAFAGACGGGAEGTGGSASTGTASTGTTGTTTGSGTSTGAGGACADANEPNETVSSPAFFNDASSGIGICDTKPIVVQGALSDFADVDVFRGYTTMMSNCKPAPTATISGLSSGGAILCIYLQDQSGGTKSVMSCAGGGADSTLPNGYTGCCKSVSSGSAQSLTLTDIVDLSVMGPNTQFAVSVAKSVGSSCNPYELSVHF